MNNNITEIKNKLKKNLDINFNRERCDYYIKKNGKIKFIPNLYNNYICMLNNINLIDFVNFPYLYEKNEKLILKRLLLLHLIQKKNFKYIKFDIYDKKKNFQIYLFNESKKENILEIMFFTNITNKYDDIYNYYYGTKLKSLITSFMLTKLSYKKTDNQILISIFYNMYIKIIWKGIYNKYKKNREDFKNYEELYKFLKEKGYVDKYYNYYADKMINNYDKFYKKLLNHPEINEFKNNTEKKIKNFNEIDLLKIIDKYVNDKFNKEYIKNTYTKLINNIDIEL
jgi:hypothetical protein